MMNKDRHVMRAGPSGRIFQSALSAAGTAWLIGAAAPGMASAAARFEHTAPANVITSLIAAPTFGDLDNDGDLDALVGEALGTIILFRNQGANASAPVFERQNGTTIVNPLVNEDVGDYSTPVLVDIDADGDLDLFVGNGAGAISFYQNTGSSGTAVFSALSGAANPLNAVAVGGRAAPAFADIDNDGDLDAFIGDATGVIHYYRNDGTPNAPLFVALSGAGNPFDGVDVGVNASPAFADIDADGDLDTFVGKAAGTVDYFQNDGSAAAPVLVAVTGAGNPLDGFVIGADVKPVFVDIDTDGDLDAIIGGAAGGSSALYRNVGTATAPQFASPYVVEVGGNALPALADIDADGDLDMFVGKFDGTVQFYRNTGGATAATFTPADGTVIVNPLAMISINAGGGLAAPALIDIDNDGDLDAFVGSLDGLVTYYQNVGSNIAPDFQAADGVSIVNPLAAVAVANLSAPAFADIDDDGDADAFVGDFNGNVSFFRNDGTSTAPAFVAVTGAGNPFNGINVDTQALPAFVDIDGDGDLDAFIGEAFGNVRLYLNTGTRSAAVFSAADGNSIINPLDNFHFAPGSAAPAWGDIDGDGDFDVLIGDGDGRVQQFENHAIERINLLAQGSLSMAARTPGAQMLTGTLTTGPVNNPPPGVTFPFGQVSYKMSTAAAGDTATVRLRFSEPLPASFELRKIDQAGNSSLISAAAWTVVDTNTVDLTLTDGGALDADGSANGIIDDPVAVAVVSAGSGGAGSGGGGGGGGCTLAARAIPDPLLVMVLGLAGFALGGRRRQR